MNRPSNLPPGVTDYDIEEAAGAFDDDDDEPRRVPCSYPRCTNLTTIDPIYGDLCYEHIRAENE